MNKLRVLVADGTASVRQFIKYALEDHFSGIILEMANTGKNIQQRLESAHFDIILYDKEMPLLDGNTLLEWLRKHKTLKDTPFIMMSPTSDEESLKTAMQLGADGYLLKPFKVDSLLSKVTSIVNRLNRRKTAKYNQEGKVLLKTHSQSISGAMDDISVGGVSGLFNRQDMLPHLLEKAEVSVELQDKSRIEGLPGFITKLEAVDAGADISHIKIAVRLIDSLNPGKKKELTDFLFALGG